MSENENQRENDWLNLNMLYRRVIAKLKNRLIENKIDSKTSLEDHIFKFQKKLGVAPTLLKEAEDKNPNCGGAALGQVIIMDEEKFFNDMMVTTCHNCKEPITKDQSYGVCGSTRWHLQRWECKAAFVQIPAFEFRAGSFVVSAKVDPADEVLYLQVSRGAELLLVNTVSENNDKKTLEIATKKFLKRSGLEIRSVRNAVLHSKE